MSKIYDIDFSCPHDVFLDAFSDYLNNHGNNNMSVISTENATKNGKYVYKFEVTCFDDNNVTTLIFEKNPNNADVILSPIGLQSFGGTFYKVDNLDPDMTDESDNTLYQTILFLADIAMTRKGNFAGKAGSTVFCINNGKLESAKECIVDSNGKVYGAKNVSNVSISDSSVHVSFKTSIGAWNKQKRLEDPNFDAALSDKSTTTIDKMNYIGRYVVALKAKEEIEYEEFKDIFVQAGLMTDGFKTDGTLSTIYKLLN